jgi:alpha-1,2-mannosyltransferase
VALALAAIGFDAAFATRHGFFDLKVYYGAINFWAYGQGELYDFIKSGSTYGFTYPPFAAIAMLPMALVSWTAAIVVASTATVVATALVVWWLIEPLARVRGWHRGFTFGVLMALLIAFEPLCETFLFGQVNMLLVALVAGDMLFGVAKRGDAAGARWWAGVGIGLATAVKLTPGLFIVYLLITRRFRAAFTAMATAAGATLLAAALAPDAAREFFTSAIFETDRVGSLAFVSNQSLEGLVARLDPAHPPKLLWLVLVVGVLAVWVRRSHRAAAVGDEPAGLALTGVVSCLISPVTWVHHLVWLIAAFLLLVERGTLAAGRRRWLLWGIAATGYAILCSRLVWQFDDRFYSFWDYLGSNAYVFVALALLVAVPIRARSADDAVAQFGMSQSAPARGPEVPLPVRP